MNSSNRLYRSTLVAGRALRAAGLVGLLTAGALSANAATPAGVGYLWISNLTADSAPPPALSFNSGTNGTAPIITNPIGTGAWQVFLNQNAEVNTANTQVSAYSTTGFCMTYPSGSTITNNAEILVIYCFDKNGVQANMHWTALYQARTDPSSTQPSAYLQADQQTNPFPYTPIESYNSTGGTNSVGRGSTGRYTATLPGLTKPGGSVLITAVFQGNPAHCVVLYVNQNSGGTHVHIACTDPTGAPIDVGFMLSYSYGATMGGGTPHTTKTGAYALANRKTSTAVYNTSTPFELNSFATGPLTARKISTGYYLVQIPKIPKVKTSTPLVTAYGTGIAYCNVKAWNAAKGTVYVNCYAPGGVLTDGVFDLTFLTSK